MAKKTITQRVKDLLFANAEAEALVLLKLKYSNWITQTDRERNDLKQRENNYHQKVLVLREVLGSRVASKVEAEGWWSARERFAKEHNLDAWNL